MSKSQELFIDGYEWPDEVVVYLTNDDWADARIYLKETEFLEEFLNTDLRHLSEKQAIQSENAKLRELVRDYDRCTMHADCDKCEYDGKLSTHCPLSPCFPDSDELRELGIEVDG